MTRHVHPRRNPKFAFITATLIVGLAQAATGQAQAQTAGAVPPPPEPVAQIPLRVAVQTEAAFGVVKGSFYNHLVGARVDLQFSPRVSFGGYLAYANLKGKDGRAHSALSCAQVEYMAGDPASRVRIPLRFGSGYLPGNGPVVRAATGLAFALGSKVDLITELVVPMVWLTNNQMLLSLNLSLELAFRL